jgi:hypothetical protein
MVSSVGFARAVASTKYPSGDSKRRDPKAVLSLKKRRRRELPAPGGLKVGTMTAYSVILPSSFLYSPTPDFASDYFPNHNRATGACLLISYGHHRFTNEVAPGFDVAKEGRKESRGVGKGSTVQQERLPWQLPDDPFHLQPKQGHRTSRRRSVAQNRRCYYKRDKLM